MLCVLSELNPTGLHPQQHAGNSCCRSGFLAGPSVEEKSFLFIFLFCDCSFFPSWYKDKAPCVVHCSTCGCGSPLCCAVLTHCSRFKAACHYFITFPPMHFIPSTPVTLSLTFKPEGAFKVVNYPRRINGKHYRA